MDGVLLKPEDACGMWPLLLAASGYAAAERNSDEIELMDLLKAIYIVDLEHVSVFWKNWEDYEALVSRSRGIEGGSAIYINRTLYLIRLNALMEQSESLTTLARAGRAFLEVVDAARRLRGSKTNAPSSPSSHELLYCLCSADPNLGEALQLAGLNLPKLEAAIKGRD